MMLAKAKAAPPKPESNPNPQPNPQSPSQPQPKEQPKSNENKPEYTEQINSLIDMGYERDKVEKAVKAANGSIDLAVHSKVLIQEMLMLIQIYQMN